ncbi:hypothetical protein EDB83DRAFT_2315211 [Lactarius deliciosus]|nr:hypothetical protein EDB83DRAFT_2315211 [Lactarius deliciosus]
MALCHGEDVNKWDQHVHSQAFGFNKECNVQSSGTHISPSSSGSSYSSKHSKLWEMDDDTSSLTTVDSSSHVVFKPKAYLYYFGICGPRHQGPKLIYRTSKDVFGLPSRPEQDPCIMQPHLVYHHDKLGQDNLWATIRNELTSIDLAHFCWEEQNTDGSREMVISCVTIWVGVLPDSLTGNDAFESSKDVLQLLERHNIYNIDVVYCESVVKPLTASGLFALVKNLHPLKNVIDPITTTLSVPIASLKTANREGTLGFYFRAEQGHGLYSYKGGPKKLAMLMGNQAFDNLLTSIKFHIGTLNSTVTSLKQDVVLYREEVQAGNQQVARDLAMTKAYIDRKKVAIEELKNFFAKMREEWVELNNCIIQYVVGKVKGDGWCNRGSHMLVTARMSSQEESV